MHAVKKDGNIERYTQMIGKDVYTVREKIGYLVVRKKNSLSVFYCQIFQCVGKFFVGFAE